MAKIKKSAENVSIPEPTMVALSEMLVTKNGVDITNIVNALSVGRNKELVTIQTALMLRGYSQEVADKETRYQLETCDNSWSPKVQLYELTYEATSVFDNNVQCSKKLVYIDVSNMGSSSARNETYQVGYTTKYVCSITAWEENFLSRDQIPKDIYKGMVNNHGCPVVNGKD